MYAREEALALLDSVIPTLKEVGDEDLRVWWPQWVVLQRAIEAHPLLGNWVGEIARQEDRWLYDAKAAPTDLVNWGRSAWFTLKNLDDHPPPASAQDRSAFEALDIVQLMRRNTPMPEERRLRRDRAIALYIRPIVTWLRTELLSTTAIEKSIERWIQRIELFGIDQTKDSELDERAIQNDLYRFLFDSGFEPAKDVDKEYNIGNGRVDFLIRRDALIPVELKVWREKSKRLDLSSWKDQARRYPHDLRTAAGYLVIVNVSNSERLEPALKLPVAQPVTLKDGVQLFVRIADPGRMSPSTENRKKVPIDLSDLGLP